MVQICIPGHNTTFADIAAHRGVNLFFVLTEVNLHQQIYKDGLKNPQGSRLMKNLNYLK